MKITDVNNDGIGMDGFDPVAHYEGVPIRGDRQFSFAIGEVTYYFSTAENMERFEKDPAQYIPTAGGYPTGTHVAPPEVDQKEEGYIGNKAYDYRRNLEDTPVSIENNVPIDIKEDGSTEMQNLSDDNN